MKKTTIVLHSGDYDKIYSALVLGNGALAMGMDCSIYFTFFGLQRLKRGKLKSGPLSRHHLFGIGKWLLKKKMQRVKVASLDELMATYKELGGKVIACHMAMEVMGLSEKDFDESIVDSFGAVGTYLNEAKDSQITLFI